MTTREDQPGHGGATDGGDHHATTDHGDEHGHDDHAHGAEALGPIDRTVWAAAGVGVVLGLVVTAAFALATSAPA